MMRIYSIRDRLLNYYMSPFVGPEEKAVLSAVARTINTEDTASDIGQAPHHYEVWELGTIDEEGHITPTRKLVCDCASLVRPGVRERTIARAEAPGAPPGGEPRAIRNAQGPNGPYARAIPQQAPTAAHAGTTQPQEHTGGDQGTNN
ncbi:MAG: nonstructural protein [Arizlama microvirus]|nr:MAG: nonstructural protein [Arizlama microvirus]